MWLRRFGSGSMITSRFLALSDHFKITDWRQMIIFNVCSFGPKTNSWVLWAHHRQCKTWWWQNHAMWMLSEALNWWQDGAENRTVLVTGCSRTETGADVYFPVGFWQDLENLCSQIFFIKPERSCSPNKESREENLVCRRRLPVADTHTHKPDFQDKQKFDESQLTRAGVNVPLVCHHSTVCPSAPAPKKKYSRSAPVLSINPRPDA